MKILHLVAGELSGGAARGAYWLHTALRELGVDSTILGNARNTAGYASVESVANSVIGKLRLAVSRRIGKAPIRLYRGRQDTDFNTGVGGIDVSRHRSYATADLVHLHWINGLLGLGTLRKIRKPVVWTLRDMWPMTGGCHHSLSCERYREACGMCPQLGSHSERDLTRLVMLRKKKALPRDLRVVGLSQWLSERAQQSALLGQYPTITIGNSIDTREFTPVDKALARQALELDEKRRVLLVGAQNVASAYKGFDLFLEALESLDRDTVQVVLFGKRTAGIPDRLGIPSTNLGFLADSISLRLAYSAADVFVAPSRADAFGKTLVEAMACGTPVVCFDATGPKDIVEHRVDGYRAEPFDASDLANGINWIFGRTPGEHRQMCARARAHAERKFDSRVIAGQYMVLYKEMLGAGPANV